MKRVEDITNPEWEKHETGIYFILAEEVNRVKIGKTIDIARRIGELDVFSPVDLKLLVYFLAPECAEKYIHKVFERYRVKGEWFRYSEQIKNVVEMLREKDRGTFDDCLLCEFNSYVGKNIDPIKSSNPDFIFDSKPMFGRYNCQRTNKYARLGLRDIKKDVV